MKKFVISCVLLSLALTCPVIVEGTNELHDLKVTQVVSDDEPHHSRSGPIPPPEVLPKESVEPQKMAGESAASTLSVPGYAWRHGCGPTAVGMVIGYYDGLGYPDLIPGDATVQTSDVDQVIASQGDAENPKHYEDYSLPIDTGEPNVFPDKSELPIGDEHAHDCIADFMKTSWSSRGSFYGSSSSGNIASSFTNLCKSDQSGLRSFISVLLQNV